MHPYVRAWRIEHAQTGWGPFTAAGPGDVFHCDRGHWWESCDCHGPHPHPVSMPEPLTELRVLRGTDMEWRKQSFAIYGGRWRYALRDLTAVRTWFGPRIAHHLHTKGYVLRVLALPWDAHMLRPVNIVYDPTRARTLRTIGLDTYALAMKAELAVLRAVQTAGDIEPLTRETWRIAA